ncbi:MAG: RDD family protein [Mariniblastus sp.]|nr:RDD family protein [Mariniblastus sp.]
MSTLDSNPATVPPGEAIVGPRGLSPRAVVDNQLLVATPENIAFQYQVAGPFRRAVAFVLDVIISQVAYWVFALGVLLLFTLLLIPMAGGPAGNWAVSLLGILSGLVLIGAFVVFWFYGAVTETYFNGQSFGKMLTNLRVLCTDGNAINGTQATLRNFFRLLDAWPAIPLGFLIGVQDLDSVFVPTFMLGLIMMTLSPKYQRMGDLVAGTIVVNEEKKWTHGLAKFEDPRVAQLAELIPADFEVSSSLARSLADFTDRRQFLAQQRVAEIAAHLGPSLIREFGLPEDTNHDLLLCALYYKTFVADQLDNLEMTSRKRTVGIGAQSAEQPTAVAPASQGGAAE